MVRGTCETDVVTDRPRLLATLEGYAVEGGFDRPHEPTTCYRPTIALGRHDGPGEAQGLWRDYERVIDLAATLGIDGLRISVEWARVEPRRGQVDAAALDRYAQVASHARALGLHVTVAIIDAAWPSWLGLEAWLLPWVVPCAVIQAQRVVTHLDAAADRVVVFTDADGLVTNGYLNEMAPPWRRGASDDAASARIQIDEILRLLRADEVVGPKMVGVTNTISLDLTPEGLEWARAASRDCEEVYLRSLVKGDGPSAAPAGLLERHDNEWSVSTTSQMLRAWR
jgi:beta-glucosidase/6-phospho-beta-glucosidase/beta-galactosidase